MIKDSLITKTIQVTADECDSTAKDVEEIVDSMYEFIRSKVQEPNFPEMSIEELQKTKKNFNIPALGKLYVSEGKFKHLNKL